MNEQIDREIDVREWLAYASGPAGWGIVVYDAAQGEA